MKTLAAAEVHHGMSWPKAGEGVAAGLSTPPSLGSGERLLPAARQTCSLCGRTNGYEVVLAPLPDDPCFYVHARCLDALGAA